MSTTYRTISGDMWDAIAYKTMGSTDYTGALISANRAHADIYIFPAGVVLTVPDVPATVSGNLPPWKRAGILT